MSDDKTITIILAGDKSDHEVPVSVNGTTIRVPRNKEFDVHPSYAEALTNSGYDVTVVSPDGAGDDRGAVPGAENIEVEAKRDGPDDDHSKTGQVDKEFAPEGYQPEPGAAEADDPDKAPGSASSPPPELRQGAAEAGAGRPEGEQADAFDADSQIEGNIDDVVARLTGHSPEQLTAVEKAENDREKPRKGVLDAIAKAKAAHTA